MRRKKTIEYWRASLEQFVWGKTGEMRRTHRVSVTSALAFFPGALLWLLASGYHAYGYLIEVSLSRTPTFIARLS